MHASVIQPGWITCKLSQISVSQHVSLGIRLHSPEPENTALTVTNLVDSLKRTKTTSQQIFKRKLSRKIILMCLEFQGVKNPV